MGLQRIRHVNFARLCDSVSFETISCEAMIRVLRYKLFFPFNSAKYFLLISVRDLQNLIVVANRFFYVVGYADREFHLKTSGQSS